MSALDEIAVGFYRQPEGGMAVETWCSATGNLAASGEGSTWAAAIAKGVPADVRRELLEALKGADEEEEG